MIRYNEEKQRNEIALINIFESINGEGYAAGKPTVFIRTMGCNLRCVFCFGADKKGQYPYVVNKLGQLISLDKVKVNDEILTMDANTNQTKITKVTNVMSREADNIRQVNFGKVGTDHFYVTGEHPFYTKDGWTPIEDIKIGEYVKRNLYANILNYVVTDTMKDDLVEYSKTIINRYIENHKDSPNFGDNNGNATKGKARNFSYLKAAISEGLASDYPYANILPNNENTLQVHHIDMNHDNDSVENLIIIPARTHNKIHSRGTNFNKANTVNSIELTQNRTRRFNEGYSNTVINIETEDHSYYVMAQESGSAILVHNCDTKECWNKENFKKIYPDRDDFMWMTAQEIFDKVDSMESGWTQNSICLTGGEPLHLDNKEFMMNELIPLFVEAKYDTGIETDGGIDYTDYKKKFGDAKIVNAHGDRQGVTIIADYKLPHSHMNKQMLKSNFKIYSDLDLVKMVISDDEEDWKELDWVVKESGTKASLYISPCFGEVTMHKIPDYIMANPQYHIKAQLQIHKFFWSPTKRDV